MSTIIHKYQSINLCTLLDIANLTGIRSLRYLRKIKSKEILCSKSLYKLLSLDLLAHHGVVVINNEIKIYLRYDVLLPWPRWKPPTPHEIKIVMRAIGPGKECAELVGVSGRTIRKWGGGIDTKPYSVWWFMCSDCGNGFIWKK